VTVLSCTAIQASASCIHGTLESAGGKPIGDAVVTLFAPESDTDRLVRLGKLAPRAAVNAGKSTARGSFVVDPKRRGDFDVVIIADGYVPLLLKASAGKNLGHIVLKTARELTGSVACKADPVAGADVVIVGRDGAEMFLTTDRSGHFRVPEPSLWSDDVRAAVRREPSIACVVSF
jgi:hypothetical protein